MAWLEIDGVTYPAQQSGANQGESRRVGRLRRAFSGRLRSFQRPIEARNWSFTLGPMLFSEYETLMASVAQGYFVNCTGDAFDGDTINCLVSIEQADYIHDGSTGSRMVVSVKLEEARQVYVAPPAPGGGDASALAVDTGDNAFCGYVDTAAFHAAAAYPKYSTLFDGTDGILIGPGMYAGCPPLRLIHGPGKGGGFLSYFDPVVSEDVWTWQRLTMDAGWPIAGAAGAFTGLQIIQLRSAGLPVPLEGTIRHTIHSALRSGRLYFDIEELYNGPGPFVEVLHSASHDVGPDTLLLGAGIREFITFTNRVDAGNRRKRAWIGAPGNNALLTKILDTTYPSTVSLTWERTEMLNTNYTLPGSDYNADLWGWGFKTGANPWGVTL